MPVDEQVPKHTVEPGNDPISAPHGMPLRHHAEHGDLEQIFGIGAAANALLEEGEQRATRFQAERPNPGS